MKKILRLGTRGSPLALIQAEEVRSKLYAMHPALHLEGEIEIVPIRTSGDWRPEQKERTFMEMGGNKGFFTKEIEEALQAGFIDMAVHSMKDVETWLPDRLEIAALLKRGDPRDAFISSKAHTLDELPKGAVVGTSSLRRQAQILARRPDLLVQPLRGNVDTRLRKLAAGEADATLLAMAGLIRLRTTDRVASILETDIMLPSAGQGAIGIEVRKDDRETGQWLDAINCAETACCIRAERAALRILDGSCHTPIGALAQVQKDRLALEALVAKPDGSEIIRMSKSGRAKDAEKIGAELGEEIKRRLPDDFFAAA